MATPTKSDALVFFGATGDLAFKEIFPALLRLVGHHGLRVPIVGIAREEWSRDKLIERARESVAQRGGADRKSFDALASQLDYVGGDYRDAATFQHLRDRLKGAQHPLHYLAIPPSMFATVAEGLSAAKLTAGARIVVEKPFGRDRTSAVELNATIHRFFPEEDIFRIDHYVGKEEVQNLLYFRFANPLILAGWGRDHIASVQITMAEDFGVRGRGKFYEEVGAVRDVVQNHMLQVIAFMAMESPARNDHNAIRNERGRLLEAVRTLTPDDIVRGQFEGYTREPGVRPDSRVETYAALRFMIDNARWEGVPFFVRVGKCLPVTVTEVLVTSKGSTSAVLDEKGPSSSNYFRFRLTPDFVLALGTNIKKPGIAMVGEPAELVAHNVNREEQQPYERLLGDAMQGDAALFARQDAVESSWRIVDPVVSTQIPLYPYKAGSWGPAEVDGKIVPEGGWHNPVPS